MKCTIEWFCLHLRLLAAFFPKSNFSFPRNKMQNTMKEIIGLSYIYKYTYLLLDIFKVFLYHKVHMFYCMPFSCFKKYIVKIETNLEMKCCCYRRKRLMLLTPNMLLQLIEIVRVEFEFVFVNFMHLVSHQCMYFWSRKCLLGKIIKS